MLRADSQCKAAVRCCWGPRKVVLRTPCQACTKIYMHFTCRAGAIINGNMKGAVTLQIFECFAMSLQRLWLLALKLSVCLARFHAYVK